MNGTVTTGNLCASSASSEACRACTGRVEADIGEDCQEFDSFFTSLQCSCDVAPTGATTGCSCEVDGFTTRGILAVVALALLLIALLVLIICYCRRPAPPPNEVVVHQPADVVPGHSFSDEGMEGAGTEDRNSVAMSQVRLYSYENEQPEGKRR